MNIRSGPLLLLLPSPLVHEPIIDVLELDLAVPFQLETDPLNMLNSWGPKSLVKSSLRILI
ncbi:hypothetical protein RchiOBHm_Chr5g0079601 [Rosa chinensis]|uniref:Uncharacterized protein n=1 Tax=Rosa chinensis TaxID=74649 RepID=A0A2P6QMK2_ROSCH|nr:hypothetical protein RchiOBHm_Chr5g0079601 [Rosa chinensis]